MNDDLFSTKAAAFLINMPESRFRQKGYSLGIVAFDRENKLFYNLDQINQIKNYKPKRNSPLNHERHDEILLYWKTSKNNTAPQIAKEFNIKTCQVNAIINRYLEGLKPRI